MSIWNVSHLLARFVFVTMNISSYMSKKKIIDNFDIFRINFMTNLTSEFESIILIQYLIEAHNLIL